MLLNTTKAKLRAGDAVFGCFVRYPDPSFVEVLAYQGWDFLVFDAEHGTIEPRDCENMVRAAELHGVTPIIRVTTNLQPIILRYMDTGVQGAQVPWINSRQDAERAVHAIKFYPHGSRGLASSRAAEYGQRVPFSQYVENVNAETLVIVQAESAEAVEQVSNVASVDGVDVVFIGPTDLSHSLGYPGQPAAPAVKDAMQVIQDAVAKSNATLGIFVANAQAAREWRDRGARYLVTTIESFLRSSMREYLEAVRK